MFIPRVLGGSWQAIKWINFIGVIITVSLFIKLNIPAPPVFITDPQFANASWRPPRPILHIPTALVHVQKLSTQRLLVHDERTDACQSRRLTTDCDVSIIVYADELSIHNLDHMLSMLLLTTDPGITLDIVIIVDAMVNKRIFQSYQSNYAHLKGIIFQKTSTTGKSEVMGIASKLAKGAVLIFMNPDTWATRGWIMELCLVIKENPRSIIYPHTDILDIKYEKWIYKKNPERSIPSFDPADFSLHFVPYEKIPNTHHINETIFSPVLNPNIFSIHRAYFHTVQTDMLNSASYYVSIINISLKVWFMGGQVLMQPCAIVATSRPSYILLDKATQLQIKSQLTTSQQVKVNSVLSKAPRMHWRGLLETFFHVFKNTIEINTKRIQNNIFQSGSLRTSGHHCLNLMPGESLDVQPCSTVQFKHQLQLTLYGDRTIRNTAGMCLSAVKKSVSMDYCVKDNRDQVWYYDQNVRSLTNALDGLCLTAQFDFTVTLAKCQGPSTKGLFYSQGWEFSAL